MPKKKRKPVKTGRAVSARGRKYSSAGKKKSSSIDKKRKSSVLKIISILFLVICLAGLGTLGGLIYGYATKTTLLDLNDLKIRAATTYIYDDAGNEILQFTGSQNMNREQVLYKDIPRDLGDAFVSIEDERFFDHFGVDVPGILRALWLKLLNPNSRMQGASTITQQTVRTITQEYDVNLNRKIQEWVRSIQLEKKLEKWQILELYMNVIYLGNNIYGVQAASKQYFGKPVSDLSLAECALLAGIANNPADMNPFTEEGRENAIKRQRVILAKMLELGPITQEEYDQARAEEIIFAKKGDFTYEIPIQSYFVDQVVEDVISALIKKGYSEDYAETMIYNHGLKIFTTQSTAVQNALTEVFTDDSYFYKDNEQAAAAGEIPQAAMVVIDPENGQIKGIYGGSGEKTASRIFNRATHSERQPGSSIKPIAVYGPALDQRLITAATVIDDIAMYLNTDPKLKDERYPLNFDLKYGGLITIRDAIMKSINVIAARVWTEYIGPEKALGYLAKSGIDRTKEQYVSVAMGGLEKGVSPLQMAAAYVPFANKGLYFKPITYTKVLTSDGELLLENEQPYEKVYSETTAFIMTDMLKGVTTAGGTAPNCIVGDGKSIPTAGKTGTTSDNIDKWFVGFTPYYVGAAWYGYDNNHEKIELSSGDERAKASQIWTAVMNKIHEGLGEADFDIPSGLVERNICIYSGKIATDLCKLDPRGSAVRTEYFISGTEPSFSDQCTSHVKVRVCTACKDAWGRYLLAGSDCPASTIAEKILVSRLIPYYPKFPNEPYPQDWSYEAPVSEYCTVH